MIMSARKRLTVGRVLTTLALIAPLWIASAHSAHAQVRIMPLGDSITGSPGCRRALLWNEHRLRRHVAATGLRDRRPIVRSVPSAW
jgi:hypothetical protein